jgi:hypothetical protein
VDREQRVNQLFRDPRYGLIYYNYPLLLFKKGYKPSTPFILQKILNVYKTPAPGPVRPYNALILHHSDRRDFKYHDTVASPTCGLEHLAGRQGVVYGPYITLPAGRYEVDFHLSTPELTPRTVATIDVASNLGNEIHAVRDIHGDDFNSAGVLQAFTLPFSLDHETKRVEFRTTGHRLRFFIEKVVLRHEQKNPSRPPRKPRRFFK